MELKTLILDAAAHSAAAAAGTASAAGRAAARRADADAPGRTARGPGIQSAEIPGRASMSVARTTFAQLPMIHRTGPVPPHHGIAGHGYGSVCFTFGAIGEVL
eukprot:363556-Hanusia_phi.AAC.1